jgi:nickel-dependent lactate racemase
MVGILGPGAAERVRWRQHECANADLLQPVGVTSRDNEVLFHKDVVAADLKVLTGRIIPHYFAGFGGGRKALIPGVAAFETICRNHRLTLAEEEGIHENVAPCRLEGNPVHLDMLEGARFIEGTFVLNTLLDVEHRVFAAVAGELAAAHEDGCRQAAAAFRVTAGKPFEAVLTSAGGAPYDCNFMQALKALFDAQDVVKDGGAVLCLAQCPAGIKDGFLEWARIRSDAELERAVRAAYNLTGHNSIMLRRLLRRARVALWSALPEDAVRSLGIVPVDSLSEGLDWLRREAGPDAQTAVLPFANVTHATLGGDSL